MVTLSGSGGQSATFTAQNGSGRVDDVTVDLNVTLHFHPYSPQPSGVFFSSSSADFNGSIDINASATETEPGLSRTYNFENDITLPPSTGFPVETGFFGPEFVGLGGRVASLVLSLADPNTIASRDPQPYRLYYDGTNQNLTVWIRLPSPFGYAPYPSNDEAWTIPCKATVTGNGSTITGLVEDASTGKPLPGATAVVGGQTFTTDANGKFLTPLLPPGTLTIQISDPGYAPYEHTAVLAPFEAVQITFQLNPSAPPEQPYKGSGCNCSASSPFTPDPIRIGTGNMFEEADDFSTKSRNPLAFARYYNSLADTNTQAVALGWNWRSTYDRYLRISTINVVAERADGQELIFTNTNGQWVSDSDVDLQLLQSGGTWTLIETDDSVETYNSSGSLESIHARDGYTQTLSYDADNRLAVVSDSFNRTLEFSYQDGLLSTVTAPNGLTVTYAYGSSGTVQGKEDRLASVTYSTSPRSTISYVYEDPNFPFALTGIIDEDGNRFTTWTYDASGRANSSQHAGGADLTTIAYNSDGSRAVTNALGLVQVYKFTMMQGVPKLTEVDRLPTATTPAAVMTYTYDARGYISGVSDWNGNVTGLLNDAHDQPLRLDQAVGTAQERVTTNSYLSSSHLPAVIAAPNKTTQFNYDSSGNLLVRTETDTSTGTVPYPTGGQTRSWTNTFDALGHLLTTVGPRTDVSATNGFTYDSSDNLSTFTDALGRVTRFTEYSGSGLPLTMVDPNGVTNLFTYDARDRLLSRTILAASGNATTTFGYDAAGQLTSITLPNGVRLNYQYDAAHRLISVGNALGESIVYSLDAAGNITQQSAMTASGAIAKTQSQVFDGLNRLLQAVGAAGQITTYAYDNDNNRVATVDALANQTTRAFDPLNRLASIVDPLKNITGLGYDARDNLTSVTDPRSLVTTYVYDGFGHIIQESSPDKGTTVYLLDQAGNRTNQVDARGVVTVRTFDKLNRVTSEMFPASPSENITYTYDATDGGSFGIGRLTGYTDETGSTSLRYNERGDVVTVSRTINGVVFNTAYGYDTADNVTNIVYPSGHVVGYARDAMGRVSSVLYRPSVSGGATVLASSVTYAPFGPLTGLVYGNGLTRTVMYDKDYRIDRLITAADSPAVQDLAYSHNPVNNITAIADNLAAGNSQNFAYDSDYRLTQATGNYGVEQYAYDANGNRVAHIAGGTTENYSYAANANQLQFTVKSGVTRSFTYTANGNLSSDDRGTRTNLVFAYGNRNRYSTLSADGITIAACGYNALGERLTKTTGGTTTVFQYDRQGHLMSESLGDGALIREYIWLDDMPLAQIEGNGALYYIHPDHLSRPQKMTDAARNIVWDSEPRPFGEAQLGFYLTSGGYNTNREFQISVGGLATYNSIVQGSTDLSNWVNLTTNAGPFTFTDAGTLGAKTRFYRVLYVPISAAVGTVTNNLRFPGQYYDAESGLSYNMMRDYDPSVGRYVQNDPAGFRGGINPYVYAAGNPIRLIDAVGLSGDESSGGWSTYTGVYKDFQFLNVTTTIDSNGNTTVSTDVGLGPLTLGAYYDSEGNYGIEWNPTLGCGIVQISAGISIGSNGSSVQAGVGVLGVTSGVTYTAPFESIPYDQMGDQMSQGFEQFIQTQ